MLRVRNGQVQTISDALAEEIPLQLRYNEVPFAVMMATPCDLEEFALGFSLSEGLIRHPQELLGIELRPRLEGMELAITVADSAPAAALDPDGARLLPGRAGCGLCGSRSLEDALRMPLPLGDRPGYPAAALQAALAVLPQQQPINLATGAIHAAAWVDRRGGIALLREDVGRHNALDKLIGAMQTHPLRPDQGLLLISSRASYEMISKAAFAGIGMIAALSAPTALAVELARAAGICLIGFARSDGYNIYSHPQRLLDAPSI